MADTIEYTPPLSAAGFLLDESFVSLIVGPLGSTKTTASIMKIALHASQMAPSKDGIRRSRAVWIRNTREQLRDTSIPDFLQWFPDGVAGNYEKTNYNFNLRFDDVECQVLFRGLDDANDVRRLLSLQISFAIMDEFREINPQIYEAVQGRLGRYPSKAVNGVGCVKEDGSPNDHLWGASNPPDMDTFWEGLLSNPPANVHAYFQPGGLSPNADWTHWLKDNYYANLAIGKTQAWIDVYINAKFGQSLAGKAVYPAFRPDFHVAKTTLRPIQSTEKPLIIGMDFGLNPSVTINQLDYHGRFLTFAALTSDNMGTERFLQTRLKPLLAERFPGMPVIVIGDPAGVQRAQTDERSCFDILIRNGFKVVPARTNNIVARIAAVDGFLARQVEGGPARLIDPDHCQPLIRGYRGAYRYRTKKSGEHDDSPEKNDASHTMDADQYACLHAETGIVGKILERTARTVVKAPSAGWT